MFFIYKTLTNFLYPIFVLIIYLRKLFNKEDSRRYKEKIFPWCFNIKKAKNKKLIWFHAASIGELQSIFPIIIEINKKNSSVEILITTVTLTSGKLAENEIKKFDNVIHRYFPIDTNFLMKKFLSLWRPDVVFFVDSEIWPNLILNIKKNKIPLAIINARLTSKSFNKWMLIHKTACKIFNSFDLCLSSSEKTKEYLTKLNAKNIFYIGNIKLTSSVDVKNISKHNENILRNNKFWCAASTHEGEEILCLKTHLLLKQKYKKILTIIIPRHIHRVTEINKLCDKFNLKSQILNLQDNILNDVDIIIINSFGVMPDFFKYSKSVFVGKSTIKKLKHDGGQNPVDAAKLGCKIYHGPHVYNFQEIYKILNDNNISFQINNSKELAEKLIEDLQDNKKNLGESISLIKSLSERILSETMVKINKIIFNENI
jgi:3-deoxy-D-manno-octulosonic-acid transferase